MFDSEADNLLKTGFFRWPPRSSKYVKSSRKTLSEVKRFIYFNRYKIVNIVKTCRVLMQISDRVCVMRVLKQAGRTERIP